MSNIHTFVSNGKTHIQLLNEYYENLEKIKKEAIKEYLYRKATEKAAK